MGILFLEPRRAYTSRKDWHIRSLLRSGFTCRRFHWERGDAKPNRVLICCVWRKTIWPCCSRHLSAFGRDLWRRLLLGESSLSSIITIRIICVFSAHHLTHPCLTAPYIFLTEFLLLKQLRKKCVYARSINLGMRYLIDPQSWPTRRYERVRPHTISRI